MPPTVSFNYDRSIRPATQKKLFRIADGDTPVVEQPVRLVSCDTPEKAGYAGRPETAQPKLDQCRERLTNGFYDALPIELRDYIVARLSSDAADRHVNAGNQATAVFDALLEARLTRPNGTKRGVAVIPTGEIIDRYGRMLAYLAPWFSGTPSDPVPPRGAPERRTFNLDMIENGWAAFFPIYPSLPRNDDLNLAIAAAEEAWLAQRGVWSEFGADVLLGYEYRMCIKLGTAPTPERGLAEAFQRVCVDLRDLRVLGAHGFWEAPPPYRLWVWQDDLAQATIHLGL